MRKVHRAVHAAAAVGDLENPEEVLHRVDHVGKVLRRAVNSFRPPARLHLRQVVLGEPVVIPQVRPEIVPRAGVKEVEVRLADVDVVDGGVGVELLVPLLDERVLDAGAVPLLDAVLAHNLEDAEADVVAVAAAAGERGERDAEELASHAALGALRSLRDAGRHHLLHVGHVLALVVAAGVPGQLSHRGQTERRHHRGGAVWTRLNRLRELVVHPAEALVQRAGLGLLPVREGLEHAGSARGLERDDEVADDGVKPEFALDDDADHALDVLADARGKGEGDAVAADLGAARDAVAECVDTAGRAGSLRRGRPAVGAVEDATPVELQVIAQPLGGHLHHARAVGVVHAFHVDGTDRVGVTFLVVDVGDLIESDLRVEDG